MISRFVIKCCIAKFVGIFGISSLKILKLEKHYSGNYIRIINYHHVKNTKIFQKQLQYYKKHFVNINYSSFERFMKTGVLPGNKPGIMLTFDDGYIDNYKMALECLEENELTGWFMVSTDLVGTNGYMDYIQLKDLVLRGHVIGDHTATHHRMSEEDTEQILEYEIVESKKNLESELKSEINIFCWCGGEEEHYTSKAASKIKAAGYKYSFMTNSYPVLKGTDPFHIQRTNIEDSWPISLVKFQICGFMDKRFEEKRNRVDKVTA